MSFSARIGAVIVFSLYDGHLVKVPRVESSSLRCWVESHQSRGAKVHGRPPQIGPTLARGY